VRSRAKHLLVALFSLSILFLALLLGFGLHFANWSQTPVNLAGDANFEFASGSSLSTLSVQLTKAKLIDEDYGQFYVRVLGQMLGVSGNLRAGEYLLRSDMSPQDILEMLAAGDVVTHDVVIVDGLTTMELIEQLKNDDRLVSPEGLLDCGDIAELVELNLPFTEGVFLPETYQVRRGDSVLGVLVRAHDHLNEALKDAWATRQFDSPVETPEELLILASLIEKETGQASERGRISQVFHLRLKTEMRLQTDPTVIYALGSDFDGNIRRADLRIDSPYNTYRHKGLPPTPIALPSMSSIKAAAQPDEGEYLYFVARGDGSSQFSKTLAEHNKAVREFQLK
jgi:UPF0755 protein